jgi:hypothetical protein
VQERGDPLHFSDVVKNCPFFTQAATATFHSFYVNGFYSQTSDAWKEVLLQHINVTYSENQLQKQRKGKPKGGKLSNGQ